MSRVKEIAAIGVFAATTIVGAGVGSGEVSAQEYSGGEHVLDNLSRLQKHELVESGAFMCEIDPKVSAALGQNAIKIIQSEQSERGYNHSAVDGIYGKGSCEDTLNLQDDKNLYVDGVVGMQMVNYFGGTRALLSEHIDLVDTTVPQDRVQSDHPIYGPNRTSRVECADGIYDVKRNDGWNLIARNMGVSVSSLLKANSATIATPLYPGRDVCRPSQSSSSSAATSAPRANRNNTISPNTQECSYTALNKSEVARLLGESTNIDAGKLCNEIIEFQKQYASPADGNVGSYTATKLIEKAKNPCNIYGTTVNDCAIGIQKYGNNGSLFMVEDGEIVMKTSARFGNPGKSNGKKTPEGQFSVQRTKKGEHVSTNCDVVCMWNPIYFNGGIAVHGTKTPDNPNGSLGCVGISISKSEMLFAQYEDGNIKKIVIVDFQRN